MEDSLKKMINLIKIRIKVKINSKVSSIITILKKIISLNKMKMSTIIHLIFKIKIPTWLNKINQLVLLIIKILYKINKIIPHGLLKISNWIKQFLISLIIKQVIIIRFNFNNLQIT